MAPVVGKASSGRQRSQWNVLSCVESASVPTFLEQYGYLASDPRQWQSCDSQPEFSIRVTSHSEVDHHTQYHVECSITWPSKDGTHLMLAWGVDRRLLHFRLGLHDPIKRELRSNYGKLFRDAHFARRYGPKGTTEKLNRWCCRLAHSINSKIVPPIAVMLTLKALNAPNAPGAKPRKSLARPAATESTVDSWSDNDEGSCTGSELGLSDAESLENTSFPDGVDAFCLDETNTSAKSLEAVIGSDFPHDAKRPDENGIAGVVEEGGATSNAVDGFSSGDDEDVHDRNVYSPSRSLSPIALTESFDSVVNEGAVITPLRLQALGKGDAVGESSVDMENKMQSKIPSCSGSGPNGDPPSHLRTRLRPCLANDSTEGPATETAMEAKLRARKQIVDPQKASGRGMLF